MCKQGSVAVSGNKGRVVGECEVEGKTSRRRLCIIKFFPLYPPPNPHPTPSLFIPSNPRRLSLSHIGSVYLH